MSTIQIFVDCMDESPINVFRVERDRCVCNLIVQVRNDRAMYHIDCLTVKAFSGNNELQHITRISEVLESGCGSKENPLKLKFGKCI